MEKNMALTDEQVERYARHLILKGVGVKGQKRLLASSVLIIGAGGLGSPAALYLAAAGVGHIGLVDGDVVDMTQLCNAQNHSIPLHVSERPKWNPRPQPSARSTRM